MKKIMFNDRYCLTAAVLEGRKTQTRRIIKELAELLPYSFTLFEFGTDDKGKAALSAEFETNEFVNIYPKYQYGEIVAVAQAYGSDDVLKYLRQLQDIKENSIEEGYMIGNLMSYKGWSNKMFVKPELMPHQIRIENIRYERLQDISEADVYAEGFRNVSVNNGWGNYANHWETSLVYYDRLGNTKNICSREPLEAFSFLIDKINGVGTWESNPWVFVYDFKLIR